MEANLTGADAIQYSLHSGEPGGINSPEYLRTVEAFAEWFRAQPQVVHVSSITDIMRRLNKNMHGDDERFDTLPEERDLGRSDEDLAAAVCRLSGRICRGATYATCSLPHSARSY